MICGNLLSAWDSAICGILIQESTVRVADIGKSFLQLMLNVHKILGVQTGHYDYVFVFDVMPQALVNILLLNLVVSAPTNTD